MELKFHDTYNIEGNGPMQELTPEQIKEEEHKRRKRAWNRTYWRRRKERNPEFCGKNEGAVAGR